MSAAASKESDRVTVPSIEDKVVRFADEDRHQIFVEPEGRKTLDTYINGLSMSLPEELQTEIVRSLPGLEKAEIMRPAYAVEYDYAPPTQLYPHLETKRVENLFFAGQINGTTGLRGRCPRNHGRH